MAGFLRGARGRKLCLEWRAVIVKPQVAHVFIGTGEIPTTPWMFSRMACPLTLKSKFLDVLLCRKYINSDMPNQKWYASIREGRKYYQWIHAHCWGRPVTSCCRCPTLLYAGSKYSGHQTGMSVSGCRTSGWKCKRLVPRFWALPVQTLMSVMTPFTGNTNMVAAEPEDTQYLRPWTDSVAIGAAVRAWWDYCNRALIINHQHTLTATVPLLVALL